MVVEVMRQPGSDIEHNFEAGRPVCFFTIKNDMGTAGAEGYEGWQQAPVSLLHSYRQLCRARPYGGGAARQRTHCRPAASGCSRRTAFLRRNQLPSYVRSPLDRVIRARSGRLADLRDIFYTKAPASRYTFDAMRFPWLNASQEKAVNEVLWAKDVAVVHGPPGTGKTTTLVEAIFETLRRESQVLVCAQSNMAVDWISEKLVDRGINVLRIGNPTRVNDKMLSFTYERRFEAHPDYPQLWSIRKAIRELRQQRKHADSWHQKMDRLKSRATELELRIRSSFSVRHVSSPPRLLELPTVCSKARNTPHSSLTRQHRHLRRRAG